jgi:ATP-dependent Clp protease protease subunit
MKDLINDFSKYATMHMNIPSTALQRYRSSITPYIMEERELNVLPLDVFSRMMMERIIFLGTPITDEVANIITAQLLYLESVSKKDPIQIYINSPGGYVHAGLGIYDTMQYIEPVVSTICMGLAASMASVILCAGTKGKRYALPHSKIMIHQPMGGAEGQASDILIAANEIMKTKTELINLISTHSNQPIETVSTDIDRDFWMTSAEAKEYGMIDSVLIKPKK